MKSFFVASSFSFPRTKAPAANNNGGAATPVVTVSFSNLPPEVIARIAGNLDRTSLNSFALTCQNVQRVVDHPGMVTKPWSNTRCPFQAAAAAAEPYYRAPSRWLMSPFRGAHSFLDDESEDSSVFSRHRQIIFSKDGSRLAHIAFDARYFRARVRVWDRTHGFLGELQWPLYVDFQPVFSPNNQLLVLGIEMEGITLCQLPPISGEHPRRQQAHRHNNTPPLIASSQHNLNGARVSSVEFLDNNTLAFVDCREKCVRTSQIIRDNDNGVIAIADSAAIFTDTERHHAVDGRNHDVHDDAQRPYSGRLACFSGKKKNILVFVHDTITSRAVIFHDRSRNVCITRPFPTSASSSLVQHLAWSPDGNLLVVAHMQGGLSVFDCSADRIEDIGEPRIICFHDDFAYSDISFSPNGTTIVVESAAPLIGAGLRIIDVRKGELLSDGWNDSLWKILVS
jgi:WD40 repeat protein